MDGIVLINKEKNYTSHDVVNIVKKITKSKVGHTGTLDPNATGVLPLLLGNGTKISKYLINHDKEYKVILQLGIKTSTADSEGEILERQEIPDKIFDEEYIKVIMKQFIGKQEQTPPIYSAIKVNGKKLYDYARKGQKVRIEPRKIEIYDMEFTKSCKKSKQIHFTVSCSKGTYIRSLCEDLAQKLGTVGYMKELQRTKVGTFLLKDTITIEKFKNKIENNDLSSIISIEQIFRSAEQIELENKLLNKYLNGVSINTRHTDGIYRVYVSDKFIGLGIIQDNKLKRDLVLI